MRHRSGAFQSLISKTTLFETVQTIYTSNMFVSSEDRKWYRVSLRLMGDALPVEEVETMFGIKPSSSGIKGRHTDDNPKNEKYFTNIWTLKSGTNSDVPFEEQITVLLDLLAPKIDVLRQIQLR